ncbi:class I SAM-dependent methyltransferase [Alphaproteobacteria bacterium]|nr:class I SAM-dependent methyltransferase [Alphaproteobacteria bacterium]
MVLRQKLPSTASVVHKTSGGQLHSPAAERNSAQIIELVCNYAPVSGNALEIASGTGQHIVELAAAVPALIWQPSDIDETRLNSIASRSLEKQLPNLLPPIRLDVTDKGWSALCPNQDFILLVNLLHLVSAAEVRAIISGISQSLAEDGRCVIYGPFMRNGVLSSSGDKVFHQSLMEADTDIGYKDDAWMFDLFSRQSLKIIRTLEMPANNLAFVMEKDNTN